MNDTIYIVLKDTLFSQQQIIDAYTNLIHSQQNTYDKFIYILLGILAVNVIVNFIISRRRMRTELENLYTDEEPKLKEFITTEIANQFKKFTELNDKKIASITGDIARSFHSQLCDSENHYAAFDWALVACHALHFADQEYLARVMGQEAIKTLKIGIEGIDNKEYLRRCLTPTYTMERLKKDIEAIPAYLSDVKLEIKSILFDEDGSKSETENNKD